MLDGNDDRLIVQLVNRATTSTDQELHWMRVPACIRAGDEGIQSVDAMNEALCPEKVERPVDRGWRSRLVCLLEPVQQVVGTHWTIRRENQGQDFPAQPGETDTVLRADLCRLIELADNILRTHGHADLYVQLFFGL